jgi:ribosomal protein S18 acetylase RimI-like enzyme
MPLDSEQFRLYQPDFQPTFWHNRDEDDFGDCIRFLNERGQDLLRSGLISYQCEFHCHCLVDPTRTRISMIREIATNRLVAVALLKISYDWRKVVGDVEYVLVDEDFRGGGRGLGRALMSHLLDQAREVGITLVKLVSEPEREGARALYSKLGFTLVEGSDRHYELVLT